MFGESKVIRLLSIIHNGRILDLVCGFGRSVGDVLRADFFSLSREKSSLFYLRDTSVRSGDSGLDFPEVRCPRG